MLQLPNLSAIASLIADPTRALMITALLDGRAMPAGELAHTAGVTAQTASSHLARLLSGSLVSVESEGRHRYYRLAGAHVAQAIEGLIVIQPEQPLRRKALSPEAQRLRFARCCYDHLAGRAGVAVTAGLLDRGFVVPREHKQFEVTPRGVEWFASIGLDVRALRPTRRGLARQCLDWTERRHHLAGPLGVALLRILCGSGWMRRSAETRVVEVTPIGIVALKRHLGVEIGHV